METSDKIISIICLTYNHVPYIKQCLDGFLMQESTFPIEIIIHDDASTDGTQDILLEYQKKYPHLFHLILQAENQYSKGVNIFLDYLIPQIKGKYIALCEGDDYWTDPYKLQKQISFLEKYPSYSICCHHIKLFNQQNGVFEEHCIPNKFRDRNFTFNGQLWMEYTGFFQTASVVVRRDCIDTEFLRSFKQCKDTHLFYSVLEKGKGFFFKEVMSVYRISGKGVWTGLTLEDQAINAVETSYKIYQKRKNRFTRKWVSNYIGGLFLVYGHMYKRPIKALKVFPMLVKYCGYYGIWDVFLYFCKKVINRYTNTKWRKNS